VSRSSSNLRTRASTACAKDSFVAGGIAGHYIEGQWRCTQVFVGSCLCSAGLQASTFTPRMRPTAPREMTAYARGQPGAARCWPEGCGNVLSKCEGQRYRDSEATPEILRFAQDDSVFWLAGIYTGMGNLAQGGWKKGVAGGLTFRGNLLILSDCLGASEGV